MDHRLDRGRRAAELELGGAPGCLPASPFRYRAPFRLETAVPKDILPGNG